MNNNTSRFLLTQTFILSQVMDIISTHLAINKYSFTESNPMANVYFATFGFQGSILIKLAITMMLVIIYWLSLKYLFRLKRALEISLHVGAILTWIAVFVNLGGIILAVSTSGY